MGENLTTTPATPLLDEYCQLFSDWRQHGRYSADTTTAEDFLEKAKRVRNRATGREAEAISAANRLFSADPRRADPAEVARQARQAVFA